jgi:glycosyltransferase involved in cell wall biosynthesis
MLSLPKNNVSATIAELFPDPLPPKASAQDRAVDPRRLPSLSVVLPAFNEQYNLRATVEAARQILPMVAAQWEIIVVNDGSGDATGQICDTLASHIPEVRAVHHPDNKGYGAALKSGIVEAQYDWIFFSDSDGQFDFAEISRLLEHAETSDIVAGYRKRRNDPPYRALNAAGWKMLVRTTLGVKVRDIDCAFKLFRRSVFEQVQIRSVGAMVNTEIFCQAFKFGMRVKEVEVTHYPRVHGAPTGAKLRVIAKAMRELVKMRIKMREITHEQEGLYARKAAVALEAERQAV